MLQQSQDEATQLSDRRVSEVGAWRATSMAELEWRPRSSAWQHWEDLGAICTALVILLFHQLI